MNDEKMGEVMEAYAAGNTDEALRLYDLNFEETLLDMSRLSEERIALIAESQWNQINEL